MSAISSSEISNLKMCSLMQRAMPSSLTSVCQRKTSLIIKEELRLFAGKVSVILVLIFTWLLRWCRERAMGRPLTGTYWDFFCMSCWWVVLLSMLREKRHSMIKYWTKYQKCPTMSRNHASIFSKEWEMWLLIADGKRSRSEIRLQEGCRRDQAPSVVQRGQLDEVWAETSDSSELRSALHDRLSTAASVWRIKLISCGVRWEVPRLEFCQLRLRSN